MMDLINSSRKIVVPAGYSEYTVDADGEIDLQLECYRDSEIFLKILRAPKLNLTTESCGGCSIACLVWNESETSTEFHELHNVRRDTHLHIAYGEIVKGDTLRHTKIDLLEPGAEALMSSATLAAARKEFHASVASRAPHTNGDMKNYAVILEGGRFVMDAAGIIERGAHVSESHQTSRALCFDDTVYASIVPALLIDDNDVKASHAASVGRVDEDQLYYLQSRGLDINECMRLISTGYLMPITDTINDERLKETLKKELEEKIAALC
ncbi:MAG: SufD family Fe-S cluster assembly protein [Solobacterium sp.]|nr:SufD family Fe-S cluster assembly protein [Solobacterium sp.]